MWYHDNQLRKKLNLCMLLEANKTSLQESNKNTKYVLAISGADPALQTEFVEFLV